MSKVYNTQELLTAITESACKGVRTLPVGSLKYKDGITTNVHYTTYCIPICETKPDNLGVAKSILKGWCADGLLPSLQADLSMGHDCCMVESAVREMVSFWDFTITDATRTERLEWLCGNRPAAVELIPRKYLKDVESLSLVDYLKLNEVFKVVKVPETRINVSVEVPSANVVTDLPGLVSVATIMTQLMAVVTKHCTGTLTVNVEELISEPLPEGLLLNSRIEVLSIKPTLSDLSKLNKNSVVLTTYPLSETIFL